MTILVKILIIAILVSFWWIWTNAFTKPDDWEDARLLDKVVVSIFIIGMGILCGWLIAMVILV